MALWTVHHWYLIKDLGWGFWKSIRAYVIFLYSYLPRASYSFKELRHPHRQNHGFLQKLLGLLQVSNVTPILKIKNHYLWLIIFVNRGYIYKKRESEALLEKSEMKVDEPTMWHWGFGRWCLSPELQSDLCPLLLCQTSSPPSPHPPLYSTEGREFHQIKSF